MSRLIDADAFKQMLKQSYTFYGFVDLLNDFYVAIDEQPTIDAVEVVRCKECVHWQSEKYWCKMFKIGTPADGYCYMGERKESE